MAEQKAGVERLLSEDVPTQADGWVDVCAYLLTKHLPYVLALDDGPLGDDSATAQEKEQSLRRRYELLSKFVLDWDWKDPQGRAYPKPHDNPDVFGELRPVEMRWLYARVIDRMAQDGEIPKQNGEPS